MWRKSWPASPTQHRFGFEETTYLLLFGNLPTWEQLKDFQQVLSDYRTLPTSFVRDIIMKAPSSDMMNTLARSVLTLYSYDENANDIRIENVLRQCLQLIALFPLLSVYGYQAYSHYHDGNSLYIHNPLARAVHGGEHSPDAAAGQPATPIWRPAYWIWRWSSTQSMAAATIPPLPPTSSPPPAPTPIRSSPPPSAP